MEKLQHIESNLENISWLASSAASVADRRRLDALLRSTLTGVETDAAEVDVETFCETSS